MLRALRLVVLTAHIFAGLPRSAAQRPATALCKTPDSWAFNSLRQSPCIVAEYLAGVCNAGQFTIPPLGEGEFYTGPTLETANPCRCSSVFYCMISACANCQARNYVRWSAWTSNCSTSYPAVFPKDIPSGTAVPSWAYQDVLAYDNFNLTLAQQLGGPESIASPKPTGTGTPTSTPSIPSSTVTTDAPKKSNAGAIAGGVVGGVVFLGLIVALTIWLVQRRGDRAEDGSARPMSDTGLISPYVATQTPRLYDPSDPSTFPVSPDASGSYSPQSPHSPQSPQPGQSSGFNQTRPIIAQYTGTPEI